MARPIVHHLDGDDLARRRADGATIAQLARERGVDRYTIRRALREASETGERDNVLQLPVTSKGLTVPAGHVTSARLVERSRITFRQLDYWTRAGLLRPANGPNPGSGTDRLWPVAEVAVATLMGRMVLDGIEVRTAHDVARDLLATGRATLAGFPIELPQEA